eukprot:TRINITY_DN24488_c0_g1_i1.p1 TRINITY_DN24488_c0_g1~~TRINITY_DN24488_c0_g1_i1.p1  ORF type:complete len:621 (+),score=112.79 TRINITY_DN24488_c0_g1_i1:54-1916(+)
MCPRTGAFCRLTVICFTSCLGALLFVIGNNSVRLEANPVVWGVCGMPVICLVLFRCLSRLLLKIKFHDAGLRIAGSAQELYCLASTVPSIEEREASVFTYSLLRCVLESVAEGVQPSPGELRGSGFKGDAEWFRTSKDPVGTLLSILARRLILADPTQNAAVHSLVALLRQDLELIISYTSTHSQLPLNLMRCIIVLWSISLASPLLYMDVARGATIAACGVLSVLWGLLCELDPMRKAKSKVAEKWRCIMKEAPPKWATYATPLGQSTAMSGLLKKSHHMQTGMTFGPPSPPTVQLAVKQNTIVSPGSPVVLPPSLKHTLSIGRMDGREHMATETATEANESVTSSYFEVADKGVQHSLSPLMVTKQEFISIHAESHKATPSPAREPTLLRPEHVSISIPRRAPTSLSTQSVVDSPPNNPLVRMTPVLQEPPHHFEAIELEAVIEEDDIVTEEEKERYEGVWGSDDPLFKFKIEEGRFKSEDEEGVLEYEKGVAVVMLETTELTLNLCTEAQRLRVEVSSGAHSGCFDVVRLLLVQLTPPAVVAPPPEVTPEPASFRPLSILRTDDAIISDIGIIPSYECSPRPVFEDDTDFQPEVSLAALLTQHDSPDSEMVFQPDPM